MDYVSLTLLLQSLPLSGILPRMYPNLHSALTFFSARAGEELTTQTPARASLNDVLDQYDRSSVSRTTANASTASGDLYMGFGVNSRILARVR